MLEKVGENSEVHFIPAIAGGSIPSKKGLMEEETCATNVKGKKKWSETL